MSVVPEPDFLILHHDPLRQFARLVRQLRLVQKTGGSGYKTPTAGATANGLEKKVDAALNLILGPIIKP